MGDSWSLCGREAVLCSWGDMSPAGKEGPGSQGNWGEPWGLMNHCSILGATPELGVERGGEGRQDICDRSTQRR